MAKPLTVEVINFGDELLVGIRENTHLHFLGEQLSRLGLPVSRNRVIIDESAEIRRAFSDAWEHSDLILTTGGLGPTADDLTRDNIAEALGAELVYEPEIGEAIQRRFAVLGRTMAAHHEKQCYRFADGEILWNERGTAPGLVYRADGKMLVMLPGPTHELVPMFERQVVPMLQKEGYLTREEAYLQLRTCGAGESSVEQMVQPIVERYPELTVAFCSHYGIVDVRLSSRDGGFSNEVLHEIGVEAKELLGDDFVCFGHCSMADVISRELRALDRTLAVAESCTGGSLADAFTDLPGASKVFHGGIVCYTNDAKVSLLEIPECILDQHGAVSPECAVALASAAAEKFSAEHGLSITGFAGPGGGNQENPVGTIHIGYHSPIGAWCKSVRYTGGRLDVKARAVNAALDWMRRKLREYKMSEMLSGGEND